MAASSSVRPSSSQRSKAIGTLPLTQTWSCSSRRSRPAAADAGGVGEHARSAASCRSGRSGPAPVSRRKTPLPRRRWRCPWGRGPRARAAATRCSTRAGGQAHVHRHPQGAQPHEVAHGGPRVRRVVEQARGQHQFLVVEGDALVGAGVVVVPPNRPGVAPGQRQLLVVDALVDDSRRAGRGRWRRRSTAGPGRAPARRRRRPRSACRARSARRLTPRKRSGSR